MSKINWVFEELEALEKDIKVSDTWYQDLVFSLVTEAKIVQREIDGGTPKKAINHLLMVALIAANMYNQIDGLVDSDSGDHLAVVWSEYNDHAALFLNGKMIVGSSASCYISKASIMNMANEIQTTNGITEIQMVEFIDKNGGENLTWDEIAEIMIERGQLKRCDTQKVRS
ncbi:MAG: hypothetical protein SVK08_01545 [Halobacteriota archaeon]|nr:hypothetical protein [Halobacteriota archaeon]